MLTNSSMDCSIPEAHSFRGLLVSINTLESKGFREWLFLAGMLFNARRKWWGNRGRRATPHEGLDIGIFRTATSQPCSLAQGAAIPAIFEGEVVKVCDDFLGKSIFLRHDTRGSGGSHLFTVYGHTQPYPCVRRSAHIAEGEVIASVAGSSTRRAVIPSHLHITLAWIADSLPMESLGWENLGDTSAIVLIDPLPILGLPHSVAD